MRELLDYRPIRRVYAFWREFEGALWHYDDPEFDRKVGFLVACGAIVFLLMGVTLLW